MLNWIIWKRTVFDIETVYLCLTELFEIELSELLLKWIAWNWTGSTLKLYTYIAQSDGAVEYTDCTCAEG